MSVFEQLALGFQAMLHSLRSLLAWRLWIPWVLLAIPQLAVVAAIGFFAHPLLSGVMVPLLTAVAGDQVLHYPNALQALPRLYDRADLLIGALVGSVVIGVATVMFADWFRGRDVAIRSQLGIAWRRVPALVLVQLPFNLLLVGLSVVVQTWLARRGGGGIVESAASVAAVAGSLVLQAAFFYVTAKVILGGSGVVSALASVPATWKRGFAPALLVSVLTLIVLLPVQWLAGHQELVMERGRPELLAGLTLVRLGAGLLNGFLLSGCATLLYLSLFDRPEPVS